MSCALAVGILGIAVIGATSTFCRPVDIGMGLVLPPWWRLTSLVFKEMGKNPQFGTGTVTTKMRRFATETLVGPKVVVFFLMWNRFVSLAILRRGFVHGVKLYYFTLEFLGVVEIPTYEDIEMGATKLWFWQCTPFAGRGGGAQFSMHCSPVGNMTPFIPEMAGQSTCGGFTNHLNIVCTDRKAMVGKTRKG